MELTSIIFVSVIWIFYVGTKFRVFISFADLLFRNFLTIAKNAKLKTREVKYQSGMLPSPRDWIYLSHSQNNVIDKISMNLCNFIRSL